MLCYAVLCWSGLPHLSLAGAATLTTSSICSTCFPGSVNCCHVWAQREVAEAAAAQRQR